MTEPWDGPESITREPRSKPHGFDADATRIANNAQPLEIEGLPLLPLYLVSNGKRLMTLAKSSACLTCMRRGRVVGDW
jgi:hypothetical protein